MVLHGDYVHIETKEWRNLFVGLIAAGKLSGNFTFASNASSSGGDRTTPQMIVDLAEELLAELERRDAQTSRKEGT